MTREFWPRQLLTPRPTPRPPKQPKRRWPKLPIRAGKAHQMLSAAIVCGDHELASWLDAALKRTQVTGNPDLVLELKKRLDDVMEPLADSTAGIRNGIDRSLGDTPPCTDTNLIAPNAANRSSTNPA